MADLEFAERLLRYFQQADTQRTGLICGEALCRTLCRVGVPKESVEHLLRMTNLLDSSGHVAYKLFVDWLVGKGPEALVHSPSVCSPATGNISAMLDDTWPGCDPAGASAGLRSLRRARRTLCEGRREDTVDLPSELDSFLRWAAPPQDAQGRMRAAWAAAAASTSPTADLASLASTDADLWGRFAHRCVERLLLEVFSLADMDSDGKLSAQELMTLLMLITVQKQARFAFSPADAEHIMREFDVGGDGMLHQAEFLDMVHALEREARPRPLLPGANKEGRELATPPHLVLYFDVNNTVLVGDTLTGAGAEDLISMTLAGCAWGVKTQRRSGEHRGKDSWVLVCPEPGTKQPWKGLMSYTEYVVEVYPIPSSGATEEVEVMKHQRRAALQAFCAAGQPGEALRPHLERLLAALKREVQLLPSFFFLLQELKRARRSFCVVFRTFGVDVNLEVEREFNTFCEGRHPFFPAGVVLDGSDGLPDHRMQLSDPASIGTFVRGLGDDELTLVWGTHKQPPKGQGLDFYSDLPEAKVVTGAEQAAEALQLRVCASGRTVVLRDFYPAWSKAKFTGQGGKPLFLRIEDEACFPVFFDDHIRPVDPNIVDAIDVRDLPRRVPMAQVYDIHMVRAEPLLSVAELGYFRDELARCEEAKAAQLARRRNVASMLHDAGAIRGVLRLLHGGDEEQLALSRGGTPPLSRQSSSRAGSKVPAMHYTPWREMDAVKHATPFVGIS